jgi:hypothetical protein
VPKGARLAIEFRNSPVRGRSAVPIAVRSHFVG